MTRIDKVRIGHGVHDPARLDTRASLTRAQRIVVKIGSSSLTLPSGDLNRNAIWALASSVSRLVHEGREVVIVSSGAIAAALRPMGFNARPESITDSQALASVGQGMLIREWSQAFGMSNVLVGQVLLTEDDMVHPEKYRNVRASLNALLAAGAVPIVNENDTVATREIHFGDNDRLASLVAQVTGADLLVLLTDVDGLFTRSPKEPGAERIACVKDAAKLEGVEIGSRGSTVGTGGMVTKLSAAHDATITGTACVLTLPARFDAVLAGEDFGTFFPARTTGCRRSRLMWLMYASRGEGTLVLDEGAVHAVVEQRRSLLPVGIARVEGTFAAGSPVDIADGSGRVRARGLTYFSSDAISRIMGLTSEEIAARESEIGVHTVVHRDDLVLLK